MIIVHIMYMQIIQSCRYTEKKSLKKTLFTIPNGGLQKVKKMGGRVSGFRLSLGSHDCMKIAYSRQV